MNETTYRIVMMTALIVGVILFALAIIVLIKNTDEIKNDPILYGMDKHGFSFCTCSDGMGRSTIIELDRFNNDNS